jgi:hypothetical protein
LRNFLVFWKWEDIPPQFGFDLRRLQERLLASMQRERARDPEHLPGTSELQEIEIARAKFSLLPWALPEEEEERHLWLAHQDDATRVSEGLKEVPEMKGEDLYPALSFSKKRIFEMQGKRPTKTYPASKT